MASSHLFRFMMWLVTYMYSLHTSLKPKYSTFIITCIPTFHCHLLSGTIVRIDLDPRELLTDDNPGGYRVVHLVYPSTRVVIFLQSAYDAGLHIPPFNSGEIVVGVESRTFEVTGLRDKIYTFRRTQLPLLPGHLSSVYRAQVCTNKEPRLPRLVHSNIYLLHLLFPTPYYCRSYFSNSVQFPLLPSRVSLLLPKGRNDPDLAAAYEKTRRWTYGRKSPLCRIISRDCSRETLHGRTRYPQPAATQTKS